MRLTTVPAVLALGVLALSWSGPLFRFTTSPVIAVAAWRMVLASAAFLPWVPRARFTRRGFLLALLAGGALALHFVLWMESLRRTTVASSVALVTTNPIFVGLFSLLSGEPPSRRLWQGILLSVTGAILIGWGDFALGGTALLGDVLALLGAVAASAYLLVGRRVREEVPLLPYVGVAYGLSAGFLLLGAGATGTPLPAQADWVWIALIALGPQLVGHTSMNWALRRLPAAAVAVVILGEPVGAALWAYLVFGEGIGLIQGMGIALVLLGILRAWRSIRL